MAERRVMAELADASLVFECRTEGCGGRLALAIIGRKPLMSALFNNCPVCHCDWMADSEREAIVLRNGIESFRKLLAGFRGADAFSLHVECRREG